MKTLTSISILILFFNFSAHAQTPSPFSKMRPEPKPLFQKADVAVDWQEIMADCSETQLCVQGLVINSGGKPAMNVKLRIEIGNTSMAKPRVTKIIKLDQPTMNPGDQQEFYFTLDRKTSYKDYKGKPKVIEVGKYNFKIVPIWLGKPGTGKPTK